MSDRFGGRLHFAGGIVTPCRFNARMAQHAACIALFHMDVSALKAVDRMPKFEWITTTRMPGIVQSWAFKAGDVGFRVLFPHWLPIAVFATLATVPWMRQLNWRFSLRTLLIATTLVAVVLGLGLVVFTTNK